MMTSKWLKIKLISFRCLSVFLESTLLRRDSSLQYWDNGDTLLFTPIKTPAMLHLRSTPPSSGVQDFSPRRFLMGDQHVIRPKKRLL